MKKILSRRKGLAENPVLMLAIKLILIILAGIIIIFVVFTQSATLMAAFKFLLAKMGLSTTT